MMVDVPATSEEATAKAQEVIGLFSPEDYNLTAQYNDELSALVSSIYLDMLIQADKVKVIKTIKVCLGAAFLLGRKGRPKREKRKAGYK
jgi:hypothetical protein